MLYAKIKDLIIWTFVFSENKKLGSFYFLLTHVENPRSPMPRITDMADTALATSLALG